jgi:arylsulfatase A-like enzyme
MSLMSAGARSFLYTTSALYDARRAAMRLSRAARALAGRPAPGDAEARASIEALREGRARRGPSPRRNILFVTVDQQRFDALGVNGGRVARTPVIDALARAGCNYRRAHVHNVVCMPSRSTMLTGQHPRTHGVIANGVALPADAPSVAAHLRRTAGYRAALIGKAHFEPHLDPLLSHRENNLAAAGSTGPWRGFEHVELATHGPLGGHHYAAWLRRAHPEDVPGFAGVLTGEGGGDTGAPEVAKNPVPRARYHTDWIVDRTVAWLASLPEGEPFFCWMSFPDPHHPFDPPYEEVKARISFRDVPLPEGRPRTRAQIERALAAKPAHWRAWWEGRFRNPEGGPISFVPGRLADDQLREMIAMIHVENELIDEGLGRVLAWLRARGLEEHTDVVYTSDHGELQGDHGLFFKGPYHVDALLRVPLVWRPAPSAGVPPAEISEPVGNVDLAPTFCAIAGVDVPAWMDGAPLPTAPGAPGHERVITTFDSQFAPVGMHLRTIFRDGMLCTVYEPSTRREGGDFPLYWSVWGHGSEIPRYDGTEGELYDCANDPHQHENLWNDPARRALRDALVDDLRSHLPPLRRRLPVDAPT